LGEGKGSLQEEVPIEYGGLKDKQEGHEKIWISKLDLENRGAQ
jgi:hypothetical protein